MKKTFYQWIKKQIKRNDPVGDLAKDIKFDREAPKGAAGFSQWQGYLHDNNACDGAIKALDTAWSIYLRENYTE